ncbi:hypothetical protein N0V82_009569 [Gnomoniopsis sp. IMI 355080]|nr:hypothetical protein N0V82_009569 [Gnomoniopsis sp. IMI 355080]
MLSNRRSVLGPVSTSERLADRVSVCNPKPAWRRASSFNVTNPPPGFGSGSYAAADAAPPQYNSKSEHPHCTTPSVLTSTTAQVPGYIVKRTIGTMHGTTTGALPKDGVKLWIKSVCGMGAEVRNLTNLIYAMRDVAMERMVLDCVSRGGNAVVGLSFTESEMMGCITVSVQGTAVYVEGQKKDAPSEGRL